jgi:hypothetical protein
MELNFVTSTMLGTKREWRCGIIAATEWHRNRLKEMAFDRANFEALV